MDYKLDDKFKQLAAGAPYGSRYYTRFELEDSYITRLPARIFHGIQFGELKFVGCSKLSCVDPGAFDGLGPRINRFTAELSNFSTSRGYLRCTLNFAALSTLTNVETIEIKGSQILTIPENAFNDNMGVLTNLHTVDFGGRTTKGVIQNISAKAFSTLRNVRLIDVSNQNISVIGQDAFTFNYRNDERLTIRLESNSLTGHGFVGRVFPINRPLTITMGGNAKLHYLPEATFYDLFVETGGYKNTLDLGGDQMEIDVNNEWIVKYKVELDLKDKLFNAWGDDGRELLKHTDKQMQKPAPTDATNVVNDTTLLLSVLSLTRASDFCPNPEEFAPCTCLNDVITCINAEKKLNLDDKFRLLAAGAPPGSRFYTRFELEDSYITRLPAHIFHGIQFGELKFSSCTQLSCVDPGAFEGLGFCINKFTAELTNFSAPVSASCDLFAALSTLTNVETIQITDSQITQIPANAFNDGMGELTHLRKVDFGGKLLKGHIHTVNQRAFYTLPNVSLIDLSNQNISVIGQDAFMVKHTNVERLNIRLELNSLAGHSFTYEVFPINRPLKITMGGNKQLHYLPRSTFYYILAQTGDIVIDLKGDQMEIDVNNEWLVTYKDDINLKVKLTNAMGDDDRELLQHTVDEMRRPVPTDASNVVNSNNDDHNV
ncbi:unnamed protein product [Medioppia subpectinata]|uniref:Uncharacterized protein n=1 Tax=Medioppia subpectinata TaxID=1979941 RepID=A0A7R9KIS5_9ACAR|nr:unnamed protein product [Medioppia subpectinata]CAG2103165.1 unnamed protein product [Medioppia subpectinata]